MCVTVALHVALLRVLRVDATLFNGCDSGATLQVQQEFLKGGSDVILQTWALKGGDFLVCGVDGSGENPQDLYRCRCRRFLFILLL